MLTFILLNSVVEVRSSSWLRQTRPRTETDLPLRQDTVQCCTAYCWVCHSYTGKCVQNYVLLALYWPGWKKNHSSWRFYQDRKKRQWSNDRILTVPVCVESVVFLDTSCCVISLSLQIWFGCKKKQKTNPHPMHLSFLHIYIHTMLHCY